MNLGTHYFELDRHADALRELDRASKGFAGLGLRNSTTVGLAINRAVALTQLEHHDDALALFRSIEIECRTLGLEGLHAQSQMNEAYLHSLRSEYDRALQLLSRATEYYRRAGNPYLLASCLSNRAQIYQHLNLHEEASPLSDEAAELFARNGLHYDQAIALTRGALSRLATDKLAAAARSLDSAAALFRRTRSRPRTAMVSLIRGELDLRRGLAERSSRRARRTAERFRQLGLPRWEALALSLAGRSDALCGQAPRAARYLRAAVRRISRRAYPLAAFELWAALGQAEMRAGALPRARRATAEALRLFESIRDRVPSEESRVTFLSDKAHLYDQLVELELSHARPSTGRLLEVMERARAQELWTRVRSPLAQRSKRRAEERGASVLRHRVAALHGEISALELGGNAERTRLPEVQRRLQQAERALTRHARQLRETVGAEGRTHAADTALDVASLARTLPAGYGFVEYHFARGNAVVVVVAENRAIHRRLGHGVTEQVDALVRRLAFHWNVAAVTVQSAVQAERARGARASIEGSAGVDRRALELLPLTAPVRQVLAELHRHLWRPIEELRLRAPKGWVVSPHGAAHQVPFHALFAPRGWLIEETPISLVPSARIWQRLPRAEADRRSSAWIGGLASPALPELRREVADVSRALRPRRVTLDLAPTPSSFLDAVTSHRLVHLAAHGAARGDNPAFSFMEMAGGPLFVHDLDRARLGPATVVLASCASGQSTRLAGDEWLGFPRALLQSGAAAVVASLWPLEDRASRLFMGSFYEAYQGGRSAPEALASAMRDRLVACPHPWYWGAFAAIGGVRLQVTNEDGMRSR